MDFEKTNQVFEAIKSDDLNLFRQIIQSNSDLNLCYGRFPILSLCYLYESYRILDKYEKYMFQIKNFLVIDEKFEMYQKFKLRAKKSIRLFRDKKIIMPIEMLAILDERQKIAKDYQKYYKNAEITSNIEKIYSLTNKTEVEAKIDKFTSPIKSTSKKSRIFVSLVALVLCLMVIIPSICVAVVSSNFGLGTQKSPIHISSESELKKALQKGNSNYILDCDIELTSDFSVKNFSGTLFGNDYTIYANSYLSGALIKNLTGQIQDLNLQIEYENLKISKNLSFLAENSSGIIKNCEISGYLIAEFENEDDAYLSIFVQNNNGRIENSSLNVGANVTNPTEKNAFLSGFSAENNGTIENCSTTNQTFETDTVDVSSISINNNGTINLCENNLKLSQSSSGLWHPNTAGISISNSGTISNVVNNGEISSSSTNEVSSNEQNSAFVVYASGVVVENYGKVESAVNNGSVRATSLVAKTYASGIVVSNNYELSNSKNNGTIYSYSKFSDIFSSGITCYNTFTYQTSGFYFNFNTIGSLENCVNYGMIKIESDGDISVETGTSVGAYAGGVVAFNYTSVLNSNNFGEINVDCKYQDLYVGGIVGLIYYTNMSSYLDVLIKNCNSQGNIFGKSELSNGFIGGICGFDNFGTIQNCGFVGKISSFSYNGYVGGVCGEAQISPTTNAIMNSYSSASFENLNASANTNNFGAFIGYLVGTYNYLSTNAYVEMDNYPALMFYSQESVIMVSSKDAGISTYKTLQELLESFDKVANYV